MTTLLSKFCHPTEVLPHRPPMLWVDAIEHLDRESASCSVTLQPHSALVGPLGPPAAMAVEILAQTGGIWITINPAAPGGRLRGMLVAVSGSRYAVTRLPVGERLVATVWPVLSGDRPLHKMRGEVRDAEGELLVAAEFSVLVNLSDAESSAPNA